MITSIVIVNATEQIVHPAMIPIFRHCHGLVSINPMLRSILNLANFVLKMGFDVVFGGVWYTHTCANPPTEGCRVQSQMHLSGLLPCMFLAGKSKLGIREIGSQSEAVALAYC